MKSYVTTKGYIRKWLILSLSPWKLHFLAPFNLVILAAHAELNLPLPGIQFSCSPFCYFVSDLYSVSDVQYDSHGASAVISLKTSQYAHLFPQYLWTPSAWLWPTIRITCCSLRYVLTVYVSSSYFSLFLVSFFACQDHRTMPSVCSSELAIETVVSLAHTFIVLFSIRLG